MKKVKKSDLELIEKAYKKFKKACDDWAKFSKERDKKHKEFVDE